MKPTKNIPELRFPGFEGEWTERQLGELTSKIGSGSTPKGGDEIYQSIGIPFIRSQNIIENHLVLDDTCIPLDIHYKMLGSKVCANDVLLNITGASIGRSCVVPEDFTEGNVNQHVSIIRLKKDNSKFLQLFISSSRGQKLIYEGQTGSGREGLNFESIKRFKIHFPSLPEQQKIASFLSTADQRLQLLTQKKEKLEQYKKGIMQLIFSQQLRFKDENGQEYPEWEEKRFETCFKRVTRKNKINNTNILTISAQSGLVNQLDFFKNQVASKDLSNYYLLEYNDFAYNKSYSKGYPLGATKRLKYYTKGVVSILYICFACQKNMFPDFAEHYFESGLHNKELYKIAQEGARNHGLLNMSIEDFFNTKLIVPHLNEQQKIASFLSSVDQKITLVNQQIELARKWKQGLLQKMFV